MERSVEKSVPEARCSGKMGEDSPTTTSKTWQPLYPEFAEKNLKEQLGTQREEGQITN